MYLLPSALHNNPKLCNDYIALQQAHSFKKCLGGFISLKSLLMRLWQSSLIA
jgi:hypothetical protein